MSQSAERERRDVRRLCAGCLERRARFRYKGEVRADRDHTLCFECFRAERDRLRASKLAACAVMREVFPAAASHAKALSQADVVHRRRMLRHLAAGSV